MPTHDSRAEQASQALDCFGASSKGRMSLFKNEVLILGFLFFILKQPINENLH